MNEYGENQAYKIKSTDPEIITVSPSSGFVRAFDRVEVSSRCQKIFVTDCCWMSHWKEKKPEFNMTSNSRRIINLAEFSTRKVLTLKDILSDTPRRSCHLLSWNLVIFTFKLLKKSCSGFQAFFLLTYAYACLCNQSRVQNMIKLLLLKFKVLGVKGKYLSEISPAAAIWHSMCWIEEKERRKDEIELLPSKWMILILGSGNSSGKSRRSNDPRQGKVSHSIGDDQRSK